MNKVNVSSNGLLDFICPGCHERHKISVVPEHQPSWSWNGSLESPTVSPSILATGGHYTRDAPTGDCWCDYEARYGKAAPFKCFRCHSFVEDGKIRFLDDCSHELAGQTVELPEWK